MLICYVLTWDVVNDLITAIDFLSVCDQCPGRFLGIIGQNPSVSKSNQLHVVVFWFSFIYIEVYSIDSSKMIGTFCFEVLFGTFNRFICNYAKYDI